jgi:hypothetical protein
VADKDDKFSHHARAIAVELLGEPNKQLSSATELRFGTNGSMSVDLDRGVYFDHSEGVGGGVLWFIHRQTGQAGSAAVEWMRGRGYDVEDDRPHRPAAGSGGSGGPRLDPNGNWLPQRVPDHGRMVKAYDYLDIDGRLAYQVCRFDWTVDVSVNPKGHDKTFVQRVPDSTKQGGWAYTTKGVTWLPYRLPELIEDLAQDRPIFIVEGEKKVDLLREIGVPATCNHGGAGKFPEDLVDHFKGARVILLPDNDQAGRDHMNLVGRRLDGVARSIETLDLPGLPPKGGVDDWLPAGGDAEALYDLLDAEARLFEAAPFQSKFQAVEWRDFDAPGPAHEYLIKDVLTDGEMSMLLGESQGGKSFLAIDIAMSIARGVEWFGKKVRRGGVIYQAGESATGVRRKRFPAYRIGHAMSDTDIPLVLLQGPLDLYSSDDPTEAFIDECLYWGRRSKVPLRLIVIDTFNKATPGANENDGKDMGAVLARCDLIRRKTGAHVMLVHHLNAGGTKARGHTSLFANVENVITVKKLDDGRDAANRHVREWKIAKQKDGEDGTVTKFVLRGVEIGTDADGEKVFSCVVDRPDRGDGEYEPAQEGISISGFNSVVLRTIYTAVKTKGTLAPKELALATGAMAVSRKDLAHSLRGVSANEDEGFEVKDGETPEDAKRRRSDAKRKQIERAREHLFSKGIIGMNEEWVWLLGVKVKGFQVPPGLGEAESKVRKLYGRKKKDTGGGADQGGGAGSTSGPSIDGEEYPAPDMNLPFE